MNIKIVANPERPNHRSGYTLIELLVTLVIVSILIVIAYPSYVAWILKANRADAISTLTQDQVILERCYAQNFSYTAACASMPTFPQSSTQNFYNINISNLTATTYTLTATPKGRQVKDTTCASMSLDQANQKTATNNGGVAQTVCWNP